jgi:FtsP/CotA-like multicopper oxidase with cupredoxin domain
MTSRNVRLGAVAIFAALVVAGARVSVHAQAPQPTPTPFPCPTQQQPLVDVPAIHSHGGKLKATLRLKDGIRTMWGFTGETRCAPQRVRYFEGFEGFDPTHAVPWPAGSDPIPGPTFRTRVGDLVEITFFNQIDPNHFAATLDRGAAGRLEACDQFTSSTSSNRSTNQYGERGGAQTGVDVFPDCLHGSSTTNVHFHGTHTTPSTTGDNVLLFIRPSLRLKGPKQPPLQPSEPQVNGILKDFFANCEANGPPKSWAEMPVAWQTLQKSLIQLYDTTAPYKGRVGLPGAPALPHMNQLWPVNEGEIKAGMWPQYQLGADPYCFPLPKYDPAKVRMGQSPGTHWYHAHKHGSTALNVANGMTGAFIIAGDYDDQLHQYYGASFREKVLVIQQLSTAPFPLTNPLSQGPGSPRPQISVNGRLDPVVAMNPGEVQMWRIVNGAFRDAIQFAYFQSQAANQCAGPAPPAPPPVQWRQIAQDGVQFDFANYQTVGKPNFAFNLAPANRADLLVQAPAQAGTYTLCIIRNDALYVQTGAPGAPDPASVLLTVTVAKGAPVNPAMGFIPDEKNFPKQPSFLSDIGNAEIHKWRELTFGPGNTTIDGRGFSDHHIDQQMTLNTAEEWVVKNEANDKSHPFHIHINPFQILDLFQPNSPAGTTPGNPCYVDPNKPETFDPRNPAFKLCPAFQLPGPWVWWDTFPIPTGQQVNLTKDDPSHCTVISACPKKLQPYSRCVTATATRKAKCTEYVPGWFRMRSRFVDFTGFYVLHCHILVHEDRGMMQLIEVVSDETPYSHH